MSPKQLQLQQEAAQEVQKFIDDAAFHEAVKADTEALGDEIISAIREKIISLLGLKAASVRDLINKWKGEIVKFDTRKSQTRLRLLHFLSELMKEPKFQPVENITTKRSRPVSYNLESTARKIKSMAKDLLKDNRKEEALALLIDCFRKNRPVQGNIGFIGLIMNIYFNDGKYAEAYEYAEKILVLRYDDIPALWKATESAQKLKNGRKP